MSEIALFIPHKAKPGQRDALSAVWMLHMAPAIDANTDHTAYVYSFDTIGSPIMLRRKSVPFSGRFSVCARQGAST
jgi:hypothetical protein